MKTTIPMVLAGAAAAATIALAGCGGSGSGQGTGPRATALSPAAAGGALPQVATAAATGSLVAATSLAPGTVTVTGTGTVTGTPDTVTISIGTQTSAPHAVDALARASATATTVQATLRRDGVAAADLQTGEVSLYPNYGGPAIPGDSGPSPNGYQASETVTATLHDVGRAGQVIDDAVAASGDAGRLQGVSFSIGDDSPLRASARQAAVTAARAKATELATAAGAKLGNLVAISDQTQYSPGPVGYGYASGSASTAAGAPAAPVPVQPGTQQLTQQVTGVWALLAG